jgi:hypothetical protein
MQNSPGPAIRKDELTDSSFELSGPTNNIGNSTKNRFWKVFGHVFWKKWRSKNETWFIHTNFLRRF